VLDVIGVESVTQQGVSFSGNSGTWIEAIGSTARPYRAISIVVSSHSATNGLQLPNTILDVGVGAAGAEIPFGSIPVQINSNGNAVNSRLDSAFPCFAKDIPAGSRLAVRHNFDSTPSSYGFCLIGMV
jgi:hypothetical protein